MSENLQSYGIIWAKLHSLVVVNIGICGINILNNANLNIILYKNPVVCMYVVQKKKKIAAVAREIL